MACANQFQLGVRNIILGKDTKQKGSISCKADVSGSLNNKYFVFHEPMTQAKHYVYFNVNALGVDPAIPNATGHEVALATNASKTAVASALALVLAAIPAIGSAVATLEVVDFEMAAYGYAYEMRDALTAGSKTVFKFETCQFGRVQADMGLTNGDVVLTLEESTKEITSPQTGDFVLAEIRKGMKVTGSFELKNTSAEAIRQAINFYGATIVTDDADSATVSGFGSSNVFKSTDDVATQLILRTAEYAEANDASDDFTVMKAKLKLGELTFSSENELVLPITFVGYLDKTKSAFGNLVVYGDASKVPTI